MIAPTVYATEPGGGDALTNWALRARDGDPVAQAAFVRSSQPEVWRMCAALTSPSEADDVTQECYLRAFRALPDFKARSSARTWLLTIARRTCADHVRSQVRKRRIDAILRRTSTNSSVPDLAGESATYDLLQRVAPAGRAAFVLTQLLGVSYQEAALIEGVPIGTIRSRVARARQDLMELVAAAAAS